MGQLMQKYLDDDKLEIHRNNLSKFNKEIKEIDNKRLRECYNHFASVTKDKNINYGAYKFLQYLIEQN